jgi:hypothetical protein
MWIESTRAGLQGTSEGLRTSHLELNQRYGISGMTGILLRS